MTAIVTPERTAGGRHRPRAGSPLERRTVGAGARPRLDPVLTGATVAVTAMGLVAVYSATAGSGLGIGFAVRQASFAVAGFVAMVVVARVDIRRVRRVSAIVAGLSVAALVTVLLAGTEIRGTRAWIDVGPVAVQPAEPAKLGLIIALAAVLTSATPIADRTRFAAVRLVATVAVVAAFALPVMAGGEVGTVAVFAAIAIGTLVAAGIPWRMIGLVVVTALAGVGVLVATDALAPHQQDRIETFLDADADPLGAGYNQRQSVVAIGSGGLGGKGLLNGPQTQLGFLPERHTDFVFAVVAEELGFAGGATLVALFGAILARILRAGRRAADPFGALCCAGVFGFVAFQSVQNIAMTLHLAPVVGIPLPFVSYGGSSMLTSFLAIGLVQAVAARPRSRSDPLEPSSHGITGPSQGRSGRWGSARRASGLRRRRVR